MTVAGPCSSQGGTNHDTACVQDWQHLPSTRVLCIMYVVMLSETNTDSPKERRGEAIMPGR